MVIQAVCGLKMDLSSGGVRTHIRYCTPARGTWDFQAVPSLRCLVAKPSQTDRGLCLRLVVTGPSPYPRRQGLCPFVLHLER